MPVEIPVGGSTPAAGGAAPAPAAPEAPQTEEKIQRQLDSAERNLNDILAAPDVPDAVKRGAEVQLRQVQAARAQGAAADAALAEQGLKDRFLLGAGRNRVVRGLTTALSLPASTGFSALKEGVVDPITSLQGRSDSDEASFSDFLNQAIGIGGERQIGFGDVIEAGDPTLDQNLKRVLGFGGELILDPLNYVFGVGAIGDVAKASKATRISDDALSGQILRAANAVDDDAERAAMREAAAHLKLQGFSKLNEAEREAISGVARQGVGIRVPGQDAGLFFSGPLASRVSRGVSRPFASLRNAVSRGDTPANFLRARRGAPRKPSRFEQNLRGKNTRDLRNAAREGGEAYADALALGDAALAGQAYGVGYGSRAQLRFAERFGDISDATGLPKNRTKRAIADLNVESDEVIDAIEQGQRTATIKGGREVSTGELIDEFKALHADLREAGVEVGKVDGYIARQTRRFRDGSSTESDWREWRSLGDRDGEVHLGNLVKSRAYQPGDVISGQIDGNAVDIVLETANLKELDQVFNSLDGSFFDRAVLSNNPLEIMYRYQAGVARTIGRKKTTDQLIEMGFGVDYRTTRRDPTFRLKQTLERDMGLTPQEAVDVLKIDSVELSTVLDNPDTYMDYARQRALDAPVEGAEKDLWYSAQQLMDQATTEGLDTNLGKYLAVRAQESGYRAELTSLGKPMADDALVNFAANMSPAQLRKLRQVMNRGDRLVPFTPEFATSPEFAEVLRGKAALEQGNFKFMQNVNQIFKTQATLSPGFSVRNFYGGMHHNHLAGVMPADYRKFTQGWEVAQKVRAAERQGLDVEEIDKLWEGIKSVDDRRIIRDIYESRLVESSSRLKDALDFTLDVFASPDARAATRARRQVTGGGRQSLARAGDFLDRRIGGVLGRMAGLRTGLGSGIPVEEVLRGTLMYREVARGGANLADAHRTVSKFHFDYGDLTGTEKSIRNGFIPFYTFRARNLPLQIEMLARRPGAYNNFLDFQRDMQDKYADPLMPGYYASFLAAPLDDNAVGTGLLRSVVGDNPVLTPDLPMNDLLELATSIEEAAVVDRRTGGFPGESLIAIPVSDLTPLWKLIPEVGVFNQSFFTGGPIAPKGDRLRRPIAPLGVDQAELPIYRDFLRILGTGLSRTGLGGVDDEGNILVDERLNYSVEQMLPLMGRTRRLAPDFTDTEDTRYADRWNASLLGFMTGGVRSVNSRARLNAAYEFGESTQELIATMDDLGYWYDDE